MTPIRRAVYPQRAYLFNVKSTLLS